MLVVEGQGADITLQQAADALGVHYMTVYRYVRLGLLPAHKDGAGWKVRPGDLEALREDRGPSQGRPRRRAPWAERLEARLLAGDSAGAWGVVEAALAGGSELDAVYLELLTPALASIGERWARGEIDIAAEHQASGIAMRIIGRLGPRFARRGRSRGTVVLGGPAGERHSLPMAMLADLVRSAGFEVADLGCDTPAASFARAALDADRLVAVGVSVTDPSNLESAKTTIAVLREALGPGIPVLVGGHAVAGEVAAQDLGADGWAADGRSVVAVLDELTAPRRAATPEAELA